MSCLDNTDILRIVGGNSFQIAITVKARRVSDGSEIEDFDLSASSPVLNLIHAGEKTRKYFVTQGNQAIISFDGSEGLGYYGMEMSGSYNSEAWRFCIEKVLQLVDTNAKANIPEWSVLVDDTYFIEGTISIYGGGGGGDTVQADWTETNPTSAAFILHKPDLSVYATKTEVASGLANKQDTIVDLSSIRYGAAAGATAYQKPSSGIPESDMSEGVQSALDKADSAYQKPVSGIPATDMSEGVQESLAKANSAVQTETDPVFSNSPAAEITQADINTWNAKQTAIADLADIREGAAAGATAVQPDEMAQAIDGVEGDIDAINAKIPTAASNLNQLADKAYVNSSIATNSATYRGSFNLITDLGMNVDATHAQIAGALATAIVTADNNDYAFVQIPDSASTPTVIAKIERYKHNGSGWIYEYDLNNSGFTSAQWAAINSGITSGLVGKLADLPNNSELATLLNGKQNVINDLSAIRSGAAAGATAIQPADLTEALNGVEEEIAGLDESKQDVIEDLSTIRSGAAAGAAAYQKPGTGIPESDMSDGVQTSLGKADSAYQKPANGIPSTDMDAEVQAALEKANSAVQTETDPVFSGSPAAEITQADINTWNAKQSAIGDLADIREGAAAGATAVQPDEMAQAIDGVEGDIDAINAKIPTAASNLNQLADKAYVNSSIATNSATYRGSFNLITDLGMNVDATHAQIAGALATAIVTADNNDYAFVQIPDSASTPTVIAKIERYKHNGSGWVYEYDLNNSGFTSAQWAAINSGITSGLVGKLADLPNNSELATLLNGKQNVISDLATIRSGASAGATAYQKPSGGIPASDMSSTVQQELSKANTAVQTETDPIFSASPAAGITAQNIQTWNGEPAARQAADTALQNSVSTLQTDLAAETSARQSADAALQTAIQDEATARTTADALLQQQYNALTQSDIIVGTLPATGVPNVIYRVPGTTDFTDYMWYDGQFVPMATYGLPISAEFVVDENLNKTQEEVNASVLFDSDVDEYPESNSTGVASSGGTASKLSPFYNVAYNQFSEYQTISGYYIDPNGVRRSSSAYQIRYIELTRTIDVKINLPALGNYCVCVSNTVPGINGSVDSILLYSSTTTTKTTEASTGQYKYLLWAQSNSYTSDIVFKIESLGTPKEYLVSSDLNDINRSINYEKREELRSRSLAVKSDLYAPIFVDWMQFSHAKSGISSIDVFDVVSATQDTITLSESDAAKFEISTPAIVVFPNNVYKMVYFSGASGNSIVKNYWQSIDLSSAVKIQSPFDTVRGGNGIHLSQYGYLALAQFTASEIVSSLSIRNKNFIAGVNFRYASISDGTIYENGNEIATYTCNFTQSTQNYVELYSGRININQGFGYSGQFLQSVCSVNGNYVEINIPCHGKGFIEIQCGQMYIYADYRTAAHLYIDGELSETWNPVGAQTRHVFENKSVSESITVRFEATNATVLNRAAMALYSINFYESYSAATINSSTSIAVLGDSWTQFPALANALPEMEDYNSVVVRPDGTTGDGCGYLTKELARITGASVDNWGKGSMRADNWGLVKIDELLAHKRYDYVVVEFFINDFIAGHSTVQWLKDIYTLCQKIRIAGSTPVIVLPCMDNSDNTHDMYHESLKRGFDALSY